MNLRYLICLIAALTFSCLSFAQDKTVELTIKFSNLSPNKGFVMVRIESEKQEITSALILPVVNNAAQSTIKIDAGKYGVSAYHDVNANKELDMNFFGAPEEPYGFSNNARGVFSKPDFSETIVDVKNDMEITFDLK